MLEKEAAAQKEKEEEEATKEGSAIYNAKDTFLDSSAGCQKLRSSGATELSLENGWHCFGWPCVCVCVSAPERCTPDRPGRERDSDI